MKITSFPSFYTKPKNSHINKFNHNYPMDSVSFSAMKKSAFSGVDLACVNLFKLPIEKFNGKEDFEKYLQNALEGLYSKYFESRSETVSEDRAEYLRRWQVALKESPYDTQKALSFIVYSSITKDLALDNENMPPLFIQSVFEQTITDMNKRFSQNLTSGYDFKKNYDINLKRHFDFPKNGWILIPSVLNDQKNAFQNYIKLKAVSYPTWCTKNQKAEEYIYNNNFHVFLQDDKSRICIRESNNQIKEIQGPKNNSRVPIDFVDVVEARVKEFDLEDSFYILDKSKEIKEQRDKILSELSDAINSFDRKAIFDYFGIKMQENGEGTFTLSSYQQPSKDITFKDIGVDESKLFEGVTKITGNAFFEKSSLTEFSHLREVGGLCSLRESLFETTGSLEQVGELYATSKNLKEITNLKIIKRSADFSNSSIVSLGSIEEVMGDLFMKGCRVEECPNLKVVYGDFIGWRPSLKTNQALNIYGEKR